jgi:DNA-binding transcriptional ArsR family regulator
MKNEVSNTASLLGNPGRAAILLRLMGGIALPAGELAAIANLAPQTASEHLRKLVEGRLLTVERQGRHRYYRISGEDVANAIEAMMVLSGKRPPGDARRPEIGTLDYARRCYAHLAGWLGVRIADTLEERGFLKATDARSYALTPDGADWFGEIGVQISPRDMAAKKFARRCLDWTERRHHLAGALGRSMYHRFRELKWIAPIGETRVVRVTIDGRKQLWKLLRIALS